MNCTCPLGPEDAHFPDCPWYIKPERVMHYGDDYLLPMCESKGDAEGCLISFNWEHVTCEACKR